MSEEDYKILNEDFPSHDFNFKIIIIGDSGVGKSCLTMKATKNLFEKCYSSTIGFEFYTFNVKIKDKVIRLQIWDTCGQEMYRSLVNGFYRSSSLAILVYSIDNDKSFKSLESWLNEIREKGNPNIKIFLIGNKIDLEDIRSVSEEQAKQFYMEHGMDLFLEASAKTGFNAQKIFVEAARTLLEQNLSFIERESTEESRDSSRVSYEFSPDINSILVLEDENEKKAKKCCI
jgi:small GTP-binding protein